MKHKEWKHVKLLFVYSSRMKKDWDFYPDELLSLCDSIRYILTSFAGKYARDGEDEVKSLLPMH